MLVVVRGPVVRVEGDAILDVNPNLLIATCYATSLLRNPGCLRYIGDEILPSDVGIVVAITRIPIKQPV